MCFLKLKIKSNLLNHILIAKECDWHEHKKKEIRQKIVKQLSGECKDSEVKILSFKTCSTSKVGILQPSQNIIRNK